MLTKCNLELDLDLNLRHYAGPFEAPEALDLSGPLSRLGFQDPVYVIRAKTLALDHFMVDQYMSIR